MSDVTEVVIVTVAAAVAFGVLVWPIVPRGRPRPPAKKPGCAACDANPAADRKS